MYKKITYFCSGGVAVVALMMWLLPAPSLMDGIPFSKAIYDRNGQLMRLTIDSHEQYRIYTPLSRIPMLMQDAVIMYEDRYFYYHPGVNPWSLLKGGWRTYVRQGFSSGGSTLTMQVVRLRYGLSTRSIKGKVQQIGYALWLEMKYSKEQILEAYFNLAPYGGNINGVGAAAWIYFRKQPLELRQKEILSLAAIPQNPNKRQPYITLEKNSILVAARKRLAKQMDAALEDEKTIYPVYTAKQLPFIAPHFTDFVLQSPLRFTHLTSTIDISHQQIMEKVLHRYRVQYRHMGIKNGAMLLVHAPSREIRAWVGSANYYGRDIDGQVNGVIAQRSPGSTLKPFIYAKAVEQGIIHPGTILKDTPRSYGTYNPENSDKDFWGPVTAEDALNNSRNIPAMALAAKLNPDLYDFLTKVQVKGLKEKEYYGLGLALGGAELTMMDLAHMYTTLANLGKDYPLRWQITGQGMGAAVCSRSTFKCAPATLRDIPQQLITPEAAFVTLSMMVKNKGAPQFSRLPAIAWKTGTSYGNRDAWVAGIFGPYVLIAWLGNFDNSPIHGMTGRGSAAPLFFQAVAALNREEKIKPGQWQEARGLNVKKVKTCVNSGYLAGRLCQKTTDTWFIPGVSPITRDQVNREVAINIATGRRSCKPDKDVIRYEVYEFWPSDIDGLFIKAGLPRQKSPPYDQGCNGFTQGVPPEIISPHRYVFYLQNLSAASTVPLIANSDADSPVIYWFSDKTYLGSVSAGKAFFWVPSIGEHTIRAVDAYGLSDQVSIHVKAQSILP